MTSECTISDTDQNIQKSHVSFKSLKKVNNFRKACFKAPPKDSVNKKKKFIPHGSTEIERQISSGELVVKEIIEVEVFMPFIDTKRNKLIPPKYNHPIIKRRTKTIAVPKRVIPTAKGKNNTLQVKSEDFCSKNDAERNHKIKVEVVSSGNRKCNKEKSEQIRKDNLIKKPPSHVKFNRDAKSIEKRCLPYVAERSQNSKMKMEFNLHTHNLTLSNKSAGAETTNFRRVKLSSRPYTCGGERYGKERLYNTEGSRNSEQVSLKTSRSSGERRKIEKRPNTCGGERYGKDRLYNIEARRNSDQVSLKTSRSCGDYRKIEKRPNTCGDEGCGKERLYNIQRWNSEHGRLKTGRSWDEHRKIEKRQEFHEDSRLGSTEQKSPLSRICEVKINSPYCISKPINPEANEQSKIEEKPPKKPIKPLCRSSSLKVKPELRDKNITIKEEKVYDKNIPTEKLFTLKYFLPPSTSKDNSSMAPYWMSRLLRKPLKM